MWKKGFIDTNFRSLASSKATYAIGYLVFVSLHLHQFRACFLGFTAAPVLMVHKQLKAVQLLKVSREKLLSSELHETLTLSISAVFLKNAKLDNILCDMHSFALYRFYYNISYRLVYTPMLCFLKFKHCRKGVFAGLRYQYSWRLSGMGLKSHLLHFKRS